MNSNSRLYLPGYVWYRRGRLWVAPTTGVVIALVVGIAVLLVDRYLITESTPFPKFVDSVDTARAILNVTAVSIATLTALVLTIVAIVVQLASANYSHRALRMLLQDPPSHAILAVFVGTFTYALLALLGMGALAEGDGSQVAGLTIPVAFVLAVVSLGAFVSYIDHIFNYARGTSIINRIGEGDASRDTPVVSARTRWRNRRWFGREAFGRAGKDRCIPKVWNRVGGGYRWPR